MSFDFTGKVAIVTGGASGIGAEVVRQFASANAIVVSVDRTAMDDQRVQDLVQQGCQVVGYQADISDAPSIQAMVEWVREHYGAIHILVNCAGIFPRGTLLETDDELWDKVHNVNLRGTFYCCRAVVPVMMAAGGGAIINVGSVNAFGGAPNLFAYSTSKGGLRMMTHNLARSLAADRIRANCVHPGWVVTEGERRVQRAEGSPDNWPEQAAATIPLGKMLTPEDVAPTIVFLATDMAAQITGQDILVDGGLNFHY